MSRRHRTLFAFTTGLGLAGWGVVVAALARDGLEAGATGWSFLGFLAVVLTARALAFRVGTTVLSLDAAFYVAAAVAIGPVAGALLVAVALTVDGAVRRRAEVDGGLGARAGFALFLGGMSGGLLRGLAALLPPGRLAASVEVDTIARVLVLGAVFLLAHNTIQGARHALAGRGPRWFVRDQALPGIVAEGSLLPLGAVVALLELGRQRAGLVLLCGTYLLVNFIFNRLARASHGWRQRIRELEQLDHAAQALTRSIELPEVIATATREVARALPAVDAVALIHRGAGRDPDRFVVDGLVRDGERTVRAEAARTGGLVGDVIERLAPVTVEDLAAAGQGPSPLGAHAGAWLAVPLFIQGACEGALAVERTRPGPFDRGEQRLLASLALQVGAALGNAHLYAMAMYDGLTGLFVRRYFDARVEEEIARARRYGHPFAVVLIDLDDFKRLNDTHGHLAGDRALREIAAAIRSELRTVDIAARYGGEELALILPRTELVDALALAERIRGRVARCPITVDGSPLHLTASFGVAAFPDSGADSAEALIDRADRALYRAKRGGKDRCELAWSDDESDADGYPAYVDGPPSIH